MRSDFWRIAQPPSALPPGSLYREVHALPLSRSLLTPLLYARSRSNLRGNKRRSPVLLPIIQQLLTRNEAPHRFEYTTFDMCFYQEISVIFVGDSRMVTQMTIKRFGLWDLEGE